MKWRQKPKKAEPREGDKRWVYRFAWLPTKVEPNWVVWLERYEVEQGWRMVRRRNRWEMEWKDIKTEILW